MAVFDLSTFEFADEYGIKNSQLDDMDLNNKKNNNGISIIVPFLDEADNVKDFCMAIDAYAERVAFKIELLFVDDGSSDGTIAELENYTFENVASVRLVKLSRNFGSHAAIRAGIKKCEYEICTWISMDLQEPLEMIDLSWEKILEEGYDAVYIEKGSVEVSLFSRFFSGIYHNLMRKYAISNYTSNGVNNIIINGKIKEYLNDNIESNSSLVLQIMNVGFKYCQLTMDYSKRKQGTSKWTLGKKIKLFIDSFVSFSFMPIRLVTIIGVLFFLFGCIEGILIIVNWITNPQVPIGYSTILCFLSFGFGITNISLGIIAEYLWRTFDAARKRPLFVIAEEIEIK